MLSIVQYGSGNIQAFKNIYNRLNIPSEVIDRPSDLMDATRIVLPGVGAFDQTMQMLADSGFLESLNQRVLEDSIPVLGVCVGMQIMAKSSEEGALPGLGWIDGQVVKLDESRISGKPRLPHMGWNSLTSQRACPLTEYIDLETGFYFLHSFRIQCEAQSDVLLTANYGEDFPAAINRGNIWGFQFHPEKSHQNGIQLLKNFAEYTVC